MANECKYAYASQVTLEANGASTAAAAFVEANDAALSSANHYDYPLGDLVLACAFGAAVGSNKVVNLYRRDLNIDGTNDAPVPSASYESLYVGSFVIPNGASATDYYPCPCVPLSKECSFYLKNGTDQTMSTGWTLKVTPKTYVPGA